MSAIKVAGKVGLVGTGMVGSSFAYALMQRHLANELVLVDKDAARAEGEAMDFNHGLPFVRPLRISSGGYEQLAGSEIVVITAGANQRPGETQAGSAPAQRRRLSRYYPAGCGGEPRGDHPGGHQPGRHPDDDRGRSGGPACRGG